MTQQKELAVIPQPKPDPLLKNIKDIESGAPVQSMMRLARAYGPIFRLSLPGRDILIVSSQQLVNELCDEKRFDKRVHAPLENIRDFAGDGLFTAYTDEENWGKAHRILVPAFGPLSIRNMFDPMLDIADQLLLRWERFGENAVIDVVDNMTRLTLDTIALCAFDYRFNSFYQNEMHPFVDAMVDALAESGARTRRLSVQNQLMLLTKRQYEGDIRYMHRVADELIAQRKKDPAAKDKKDLLALMLQGKDPVTGEGLSDENIRYQMVTFLIAGHETTSGLLSFALHLLLKHPEVLQRARAEVDDVLGQELPRVEQMGKLQYIDQVLNETLRLWPTAPAFALWPYEETVLGGRYPMRRSETALVLVPMLHRDPSVWGNDAERFDPDRFSPDNVAKLPPNAWKPFGNGQRACIGRPFAIQEAKLVLAMILQRFDLVEDDPSYQLKVKETLTLKPEGFFIRAKRRGTQSFKPRNVLSTPPQQMKSTAPAPVEAAGAGMPLLVLYGSNSGSAQAFAQQIASDAKPHGYAAEVGVMDNHTGTLPTNGAVVIVTASYEGQPTDNARQFVAWLDTLGVGSLSGVKYAVFGCGNRDWARTYQAVPKKIDAQLEAAGATRLVERGEADAHGDFFGDFDRWYGPFWTKLADAFGTKSEAAAAPALYQIEEVKETRLVRLRQVELQPGIVAENRELVDMSSPTARSKRHIEIALPAGMTYRAGDYLAVLPTNPAPSVHRALRRFGFDHNSQIIIRTSGDSQTTLPIGYPVNVHDLLASYVELGQPATRRQIENLVKVTRCPPELKGLEDLLKGDAYEKEVLQKRVSLLDLLERFPACEIAFGAFLEMLPAMRSRQYSISSSPLWKDTSCTLTVAVVQERALSGQGEYLGVASNYLANAAPGTSVSVAVRPSNVAFHPPESLDTPIIMICAGTGLAPFRAFIQERAIQAAHGRKLGPALLFFGCNHPDVDFLYKEELAAWEKAGAVQVRTAFSDLPQEWGHFVQHRLWHDRNDVVELFRQNAKVFACGDARRLLPALRETAARIYQEAKQCSQQEAESWVAELEQTHSRFYADVFA